jgi:hypothetical protein
MLRQAAQAAQAVTPAPAPARQPRQKAARWSRGRGVMTAFAAVAAVGFVAAYIGPLGAALTPHAEAAVTPVTLYTSTLHDAQEVVAAGTVTAQGALERDNYTVLEPPKPKPTPTAAAGSTASGGWKAPFVVPNPGSAQAIAYDMVKARGWGDDQFACLVALWNRESGWRVNAYNSSGAYGIPQALPGSKMAAYGADWQTNPATQIQWGLGYISGRYGTPCGAWGHSQSTGWY